jgi:hypothetical protein
MTLHSRKPFYNVNHGLSLLLSWYSQALYSRIPQRPMYCSPHTRAARISSGSFICGKEKNHCVSYMHTRHCISYPASETVEGREGRAKTSRIRRIAFCSPEEMEPGPVRRVAGIQSRARANIFNILNIQKIFKKYSTIIMTQPMKELGVGIPECPDQSTADVIDYSLFSRNHCTLSSLSPSTSSTACQTTPTLTPVPGDDRRCEPWPRTISLCSCRLST